MEANGLESLEVPSQWDDYSGHKVTVTGYAWNWLKVARNSTTGKLERSAGTSSWLRYAEGRVATRQECSLVHQVNLAQNYLCAKIDLEISPEKQVQGICEVSLNRIVKKDGSVYNGMVLIAG